MWLLLMCFMLFDCIWLVSIRQEMEITGVTRQMISNDFYFFFFPQERELKRQQAVLLKQQEKEQKKQQQMMIRAIESQRKQEVCLD